jgi:hypothetical protein
VDQATHANSFNHHFCTPQPVRTLAEYTALVSHSLPRDKLPTG